MAHDDARPFRNSVWPASSWQFYVRDDSRHVDHVALAVADDLVGNAEVAALGVSGFGSHAPSPLLLALVAIERRSKGHVPDGI